MSPIIVLIVDDDEDDRYLLKQAIERKIEGAIIIEASNGNQALEHCETRASQISGIDLLIIDMNMPEMDGLEVLHRMRNSSHLPFIPAVMFSTSSEPTLVKKAYTLGINSYIKKPFSFEEYKEIVNALYTCFLMTK